MKSNIKSWTLVAGALVILAACILSYILTKPAEADVSFLNQFLMPMTIQVA
ncbi:hypothetical protein [Polynucleobacter sp. MWH-UH35A]|uniref:hypothetical protein n=1 Tax=Polynucleobacter sp. MWH-UH35A TaxID=1855619 RepID=UPI001BFDAF66|nr:hypothetical protein [Polynucleobacter sp. MWH-UH35A]QWD59676.1 hypothetical protein ICV36_07675 [Polynucleobacter sp. MWH-UH35A]